MTDAPILEIRSFEEIQPSPTSWQIGPCDIAKPNNGEVVFHEDRKYRIRKTRDCDRLLVDDIVLDIDGDDWVWRPRFYAGPVCAELLGPDNRVRATYLLDVSPNPGKLGRELYQAMLDQIWKFDPSLVFGTEPATLPVGHVASISNPWLEYARLRAYGDKFLRALSAISRQPLWELRAERAFLPSSQVRQADRQTALAALGSAQLLTFLRDKGVASPTHALPHFDVPVARETLDGAGNRCIAAIVYDVYRRAVTLKDKLQSVAEKEKESESVTRTALSVRWPRRRKFLERLIDRLQHFQRTSPLAEVTRWERTAAGLNAISADPAYSDAYGYGWRILRHGVEGPTQAERMWISPTWEIYERWCFIQLGKIIREVEQGYDWSITREHESKATVALTGSKDGNRGIELLLQPTFPAGDNGPNAGFRSISRQREPDIVLIRHDGNNMKWYVFDAKYRTKRKYVLDAMASAHIYRDALRWNGRKPDRAVLLVPQAGGAPWLEQLDFIRQHGVGVHALSPDTEPHSAIGLLSEGSQFRVGP